MMQLMSMYLPAQVDTSLVHPYWLFEWAEVASPHVLLCSAILFLSGVICSAGGVGGGGVYVAVLMIFGLLSPHNAVPLSKSVVFFGAMATLVLNFRRIETSKKSVVIDFHTVRIVTPAALMGTFLGVLLNHQADARVIVVVLAVLLVFMTHMAVSTFWRQHCAEQLEEAKGPDLLPGPAQAPHRPPLSLEDTPLLSESPLVCKAQAGTYTTSDVLLLGGLLGAVILSGILRFHMRECQLELVGAGTHGACNRTVLLLFGGDKMRTWMRSADTAWAAQNGTALASMLLCVLGCAFYGTYTHSAGGWQVTDIMIYQVMGLATGLLAGLVGVGGGLIFSPFFLAMGMEPGVAVATSSTLVLFTSSSTTLQYVFTDRVIMSLAIFYGTVTLAASWVGTSLVHRVQDDWGAKRSYISLIVVVSVGLSAGLALQKFLHMVTDVSSVV